MNVSPDLPAPEDTSGDPPQELVPGAAAASYPELGPEEGPDLGPAPAEHGHPAGADDVEGPEVGPREPDDAGPAENGNGEVDDDLEQWFAVDWVDPSVLPDEQDPVVADDDVLGYADVDQAARLLWDRAALGPAAAAGDAVEMLRVVAERGSDALDQQAARILLRLLEQLGT
ncbi:hypothetical protein ACI8AA_04850 [Geodermatophilus sp. SYSU D01180]